MEKLENVNKSLKEKNEILSGEKAKMTEKWQNAIQRLKNEEKSKKKITELEEQILTGTTENGRLTRKLDDLNKRYVDMEKGREIDRANGRKLEEGLKKLKIQIGLDKDERDVLEKMNQELSIKAHKLESELSMVLTSHQPHMVSASPIELPDESPLVE